MIWDYFAAAKIAGDEDAYRPCNEVCCHKKCPAHAGDACHQAQNVIWKHWKQHHKKEGVARFGQKLYPFFAGFFSNHKSDKFSAKCSAKSECKHAAKQYA